LGEVHALREVGPGWCVVPRPALLHLPAAGRMEKNVPLALSPGPLPNPGEGSWLSHTAGAGK